MAAETELFFESGDVARVLDIHLGTVRSWVQRGIIRPVARTRRGTALFRPAEIERVKRQQRERTVAAQV